MYGTYQFLMCFALLFRSVLSDDQKNDLCSFPSLSFVFLAVLHCLPSKLRDTPILNCFLRTIKGSGFVTLSSFVFVKRLLYVTLGGLAREQVGDLRCVALYAIRARWCEEAALFSVTCINMVAYVQVSEVMLDEYFKLSGYILFKTASCVWLKADLSSCRYLNFCIQ